MLKEMISTKGKAMQFSKLGLMALVFIISGCSHQLALYSSNGENGRGVANESGKTVTIELSGKTYRGNYVYSSGGVGISTGIGSGNIGGSTIQMSNIGTTYAVGSGDGRIFVRSNDNLSIKCEFKYADGSGLGICQRSDGKMFDLVIGGKK